MSDYDYINARARGMNRDLLDREFYDQVLATQGVDPLVDALLSSPYEFDLREALSVEKGVPAMAAAGGRRRATEFSGVQRAAHRFRGPCRRLRGRLRVRRRDPGCRLAAAEREECPICLRWVGAGGVRRLLAVGVRGRRHLRRRRETG